jgi:hypothetical protein
VGRVVDEVLVDPGGVRLPLEGAGRLGQLGDLAVDEPPLEARDERHPDHGERPGHDDREREAQPGADAVERVHEPRAV